MSVLGTKERENQLDPEKVQIVHCGCLARKVDVRLPGKGNSNSHGARLVHLIITMIKWIRTSRLAIKNSPSRVSGEGRRKPVGQARRDAVPSEPLGMIRASVAGHLTVLQNQLLPGSTV